jgi:hypothetical protein
MGDKIRHYRFHMGRWRWEPTPKMRARGFKAVVFGRDENTADRIRAMALNDEWDRVRSGGTETTDTADGEVYKHGTVGHAYQRTMALRAARRAMDTTKVWTKEHAKRDDWPRAWKHLKYFAPYDPKTITPEHFIRLDKAGNRKGFLADLEAAQVTVGERHRTIKVWRALWQRMAKMRDYGIDKDEDPSKLVGNPAPPPRSASFLHDEIERLVETATAIGMFGLAAAIAIAWDTMLSPIDVRSLTLAKMEADNIFKLARAKTGRAALGTLTDWSKVILERNLATFGGDVSDSTTLFRTAGSEPGPRGGRRWAPQPYTKDRMEKDFAKVRAMVFGDDDRRQMADIRRSGYREGRTGGASPSAASSKMGNTIAENAMLERTYSGDVNVAEVRDFDAARKVGRVKLKGAESLAKPVRKKYPTFAK